MRGRLGAAPDVPGSPLVSVAVVSHDGSERLRTLLGGLGGRTDYPNLELIVVDNGSSGGSVELLRSARVPFPLRILVNQHNESFSDANNRAAAAARGELLLFLNDDVEPFEAGWLRELVACLGRGEAEAVGATLVFPHDDRERFPQGFAVQHRGLRFRDEDGVLGPALHDWEANPLDERLGEDVECPVVVAACLLVGAQRFRKAGGFTHGYLFGSEDIDLCLKLRDAGARILCSGRSLLIHRPGSTRRQIAFEQARERKQRNHRLLLERWGGRLRREHDLSALAGGGMWVQEGREGGAAARTPAEARQPAVCVRSSGRALCAARGGRFVNLQGEAAGELRGLECDVAIHVHEGKRHVLAPGQFNVLWLPDASEEPPPTELDAYDLVLHGTPEENVVGAALHAADERGHPLRIG